MHLEEPTVIHFIGWNEWGFVELI